MRLATRVLVPLLLLVFAVDFAVLDEGAFRFNTDESTVGARGGARVDVPRVEALDETEPLRHATTVYVPRRPRRPVAPDIRPESPAARSRLIASADSARSSEDH